VLKTSQSREESSWIFGAFSWMEDALMPVYAQSPTRPLSPIVEAPGVLPPLCRVWVVANPE